MAVACMESGDLSALSTCVYVPFCECLCVVVTNVCMPPFLKTPNQNADVHLCVALHKKVVIIM